MLFDSTVRRELSRSFGATLVVILTIVLTMFLIRTIGQAAGGSVSPQDVVLVLGYVSLGHLPTMLALSLFVAVVLTLGRMYRDSEMVIWFASGMSLARFARPVFAMAWPVLLVIALMMLFVWPWGHRQTLELRERYQQRSDLSRVAPGVFQSSSDGSRVFFVERTSTLGQAEAAGTAASGADALARNVFILSRLPQAESVTSARSGHLERSGNDRHLVLQDGQRSEIDMQSFEKSQARFEHYRLRVEDRRLDAAGQRPPRTQSSLQLWQAGTPEARGELVWRVGLPLAAVNLLVLGLGLSASNPRRPSNWNLLFALLAFVVYFNLVTLSQAWVASGRAPALGALAALHLPALALGMALVAWRGRAGARRRRATRPAGGGPATTSSP